MPPPTTTHHQPKYIHHHPPPPTDSQNISHHHQPQSKIYPSNKVFYKKNIKIFIQKQMTKNILTNLFMTEADIIQKPVNWFAPQINGLVSIWYRLSHERVNYSLGKLIDSYWLKCLTWVVSSAFIAFFLKIMKS